MELAMPSSGEKSSTEKKTSATKPHPRQTLPGGGHKRPLQSYSLEDAVTSLETSIRFCGHLDPTWSELEYFIRFLSKQLEMCENSIFLKEDIVGDTLPNFENFVTRFMIQMSKDFSTRSLEMAEESPTPGDGSLMDKKEDEVEEEDELSRFQLKRRWESSPHPYIFFNPDATMTFLGFTIDKNKMNLVDPDTHAVLQEKIIDEDLYNGLRTNGVDLSENSDKKKNPDEIRKAQLEKLCKVMGNEKPPEKDPDPNYVLTSDNVKKMMAIQMRFRCRIPVIVMGETGCGKTYLIRFMCSLQNPGGCECKNMTLMKIHGGTTQEEVIKKIKDTEQLALKNRETFPHMYTVLFLDEVNTTESLAIVKEAMCDGSINGRPLEPHSGLRLIAACNPYRRHSQEVVDMLEKAGLGYHVGANSTKDTLGRIPMRRLVYRVQPLPQSMLPLVWDFGQIQKQAEKLYIEQIVAKKLYQMTLRERDRRRLRPVLTDILVVAQKFMREQGDACSFVSLRDVERTMTVFEWFYTKGDILYGQMKCSQPPVDDLVRSIMLALGVCYFVSLQQKRTDFLKVIESCFAGLWKSTNWEYDFKSVVESCQNLFLEHMVIGENIARNKALKENVYIMIVCIELRIPLFLVGKPGCSKSLAKNIVLNNMDGSYPKKNVLKTFKKVHMASYQCSQLSTSEGIISIFRQCASYQKERELEKHTAVVVLDEVGLAEDSDKMPLKALHSLLEDGSHEDEVIEKYKKVGFIGISNWALDPAKMNRGILVQRGVPDVEELTKTAKGISSGVDRSIAENMDPLMKPLALAYFSLHDEAIEMKREFFGLRDFYSLVKMVYCFAEAKRDKPTWPQIEHAILRNFGGLNNVKAVDTFDHFLAGQIDKKRAIDDCDNSPRGLLSSSLEGNKKWNTRYLLLMTESHVALPIIQRNFDCIGNALVIYGSAFPKDQDYTVVCRNINRIKMCMEAGQPVILIHLENLYEALYDLLNMHHANYGGVQLVDIGLGTHRMKTRIEKGFRIYVVAEKEHVYKNFPIPLINRLEKHIVDLSTFLTGKHDTIIRRLDRWMEQFISQPTPISSSSLDRKDVFIGFHDDAPISLVSDISWSENQVDDEAIEKVLKEAQLKLLQCATPEAIVRTAKSTLVSGESVLDVYFKEQEHDSLKGYLMKNFVEKTPSSNRFLQVTTYSNLLSRAALTELTCCINECHSNIELTVHNLQTFETEQQFSNVMRKWFDDDGVEHQIFIVQCESGDQNQKLIACARHIIHAEQRSVAQDGKTQPSLKHVILIVKIPRVKGGCFNGFEGGLWESLHLDDLAEQQHIVPPIYKLMELTVSDLLAYGVDMSDPNQQADPTHRYEEQFDLTHLVYLAVHGASSMMRNETDPELTTRIVRYMMDVFSRSDIKEDSQTGFRQTIKQRLQILMADREINTMLTPRNWLVKNVASVEAITKAGTLRRSLWLYLESKITLLLAGLIAHFNTNNNMKLIMKEVQEKWITDMWIQMAQAPEITSLEYADLKPNKDGEELKEIVVRMIGCQCMNGSLPFSWIIKDKLDQIIENHIQGEHHEDISWISDVARVLTKMPLWLVLQTAFQNAGREKVKDCYLQDFVRMIYKPKSKDTEEEYELVKLAIDSTMRGMMPRMVKKPESDDSESLKDEEVLLLIHAAELEIRGRLQLFSQVLECLPETIKDITKAMQNGDEDDLQDISDASEMTLDILTVHLVVNSVQPEKKVLRNLERSRNWLMNMEKLAPLINDVLARSETIQHSRGRLYGEKWALARIRTNWNRVYAVKMCADIICPLGSEQEEDITKTCPNLWKKLENSDFKSKSTMAKVLEVLELATEITCRNYEEYIPKCLGCDKTLLESFHLPCGDDVCVTCTKDLIAGGTFECLECKKSFKEEEAVLTNHGEREAKAKAEAYKGRCRTFFVEIVSRMCFAEDITPDESVVQMLLEFITAKQTEEPLETPIVDIRLDLTTQVLRSVFIQLLLQKSPQAVGIHLKTFFESQADTFEDLSKDLAIIYSQCLEDNIHNLMANESKDFLLGKAIQLLQEGLEELNKEFTLNEELLTTEQDISDVEDEPTLKETAAHDEQENSMKIVLENIEGVAYTRLGLDYAASVMHRINVDGDEDDNELIVDLFKSAEMLCEKTVAAAYLTRVIARRYGQDVLLMIQRQWPWVIPEYALPNENSKTPDRLIVCGEDYKKTRECVALYLTNLDTQPVKELFDAVQNVEERRNLLLSIYREITSSHFHPQNASISQEAMAGIKTILQGKPTYKDMDLAVALLDNALHVNCPGLKVSPETSHSVLDIIVHFGLSMATLPEGGPTGLFKLLVSNPASLKGCFLPTMPEDNRAEFYETIRQAAAVSNKYDNSTLYECENGHPYVIENCGQAVYQRLCPTCGITIGGQHYTLAQRNVKLDRVEDTTKPGHCLGQASERGQVIELERDLTPASTALLRLFVHLALYVGANTHLEAVQELITPELENKDEVPDFLWLHIIRDLKQIETVTGKSNDECALLVHLLIHNLLISSVEGEIEPRLKTKNSRRAWENLFDSTCIKPVIKDIDQTLLEANQRIIDDNRVGSRAPMLKIIHETEDAGPVHNITQLPAMWRYRARVTLENLAMKLSEERRANNERQYCVLELFLKKERQLRVVQHLPNIVRFVLMASQYYHRKAGRDIAEADTVEDYIQNIQKESKQTEARKLFQEVCEAWKYVQPHLNQHGSKVIPERYCRIEMTEETPITALLPNDRGKGLCITGLLHYLMSVHNEFVNEFCHLSHNVSGRPEVSLKEVNQTHLISYHPEQDLLPLISAHCNYSLEVRHGTRIEYNFASLEQNLKDRFIAGKAQLKFDIENVIFCEDLNNAKQFQKLQRKIPQSHLEPPVMDQICKDFRYMNELDDCLSNLDKTIGFLVTIGGKPDMFLRVFMADTLCMDESVLTRKARQLCRLKHIRALWLLLSLEREKLVAKHKQESFTTVDASKYKKPLDPEQKRELEHGLQQMSCDLLLARLYEFIVLHVKPDPHDEDYVDNSEQPLCMHLDHYLEDLELPEIPALNDGTFPESILVDQSVETWLAINAYTRKKK